MTRLTCRSGLKVINVNYHVNIYLNVLTTLTALNVINLYLNVNKFSHDI